MHKVIYNQLQKVIEKSSYQIKGAYFDFVSDYNINSQNNYIVYSLVSNKSNYDFCYNRCIYQIATYSPTLNTAIEIQREIGKHFTSLCTSINDIEICGCTISNETQTFDSNFYQAISIIEILYKY